MSEKEKPDSQRDLWDDMNTNRGGRKDGGTPDYEKNQSNAVPHEEHHTVDKTGW